MHRIRERSFTLLEIVIVLTILGIAATAVGGHILKLVAHHRFQATGTRLCVALEEAQAMAIIHHTECELVIYSDKGELKYQFKTDEPRLNLQKTPKVLHGVERVVQEKQQLLATSNQGQKIEFVIRASGRIDPAGILALHASARSLWVDLQTPLQIYLKSSEPLKKKEDLPAPVHLKNATQ